MTTRLVQLGPDEHESGTAAFQVHGPTAAATPDPDLLRIAIVQPGPTEKFLDPRNPADPWTTSVFYFRPQARRRQGASLWLEIAHGVTYHLLADRPYRLRIRSEAGDEFEEVFTGPRTMRRPSQPPRDWTPPPEPSGPLSVPVAPVRPTPEPVVAPEPMAPPPPPPPPPASPPPPPPPPTPTPPPVAVPPDLATPVPPVDPAGGKTGGRGKWLGLVLLLLVLAAAGAGAWWWTHRGDTAPGPAPAVPPASAGDTGITNMDQCRKAVRAAPDPAVARGQAEALAKAGVLPDCQLLLLLDAAEKKNIPAARMLGLLYDPDTWSPQGPFQAPNPEQATKWHKRAAEGGDVESEYRYGMLLKLGRTDEPNAPELAQHWLEKAAADGSALAKDALAK